MNWIKQVRQHLQLTQSDFARKMGRQLTEIHQFEKRSNRITSFVEVCRAFYLYPYIEISLQEKKLLVSLQDNVLTKLREIYDEPSVTPTLCKAIGVSSGWYYSVEGDDQQTKSIEKIVHGLQGTYQLIFTPFTEAELEQHRWQAVKRLVAGESLKVVANTFKVSAVTLQEWYDLYTKEGMAGLRRKPEIKPVYFFPLRTLVEEY